MVGWCSMGTFNDPWSEVYPIFPLVSRCTLSPPSLCEAYNGRTWGRLHAVAGWVRPEDAQRTCDLCHPQCRVAGGALEDCVCVWTIWTDVKHLFREIFPVLSAPSNKLQGACGHHANACQRSYALCWKPGLITLGVKQNPNSQFSIRCHFTACTVFAICSVRTISNFLASGHQPIPVRFNWSVFARKIHSTSEFAMTVLSKCVYVCVCVWRWGTHFMAAWMGKIRTRNCQLFLYIFGEHT